MKIMTIDSEEDSNANVIRIGRDYQAEVPPVGTLRVKPAPESMPEHAVLVWSPSNSVKEGECKFRITISTLIILALILYL